MFPVFLTFVSRMSDLARWCLNDDAINRPEMREIVQELSHILTSSMEWGSITWREWPSLQRVDGRKMNKSTPGNGQESALKALITSRFVPISAKLWALTQLGFHEFRGGEWLRMVTPDGWMINTSCHLFFFPFKLGMKLPIRSQDKMRDKIQCAMMISLVLPPFVFEQQGRFSRGIYRYIRMSLLPNTLRNNSQNQYARECQRSHNL